MGSGRANSELTYSSKKPRERRRRDALHKKRLLALGVPESALARMTTQAMRELLKRPEQTRAQWAKRA